MNPNDPNLKVTRYEVYYGGLQVNNQVGDFIPHSEHKRVVQYLLDRIAQLESPMYCVQEDGKIERMPVATDEWVEERMERLRFYVQQGSLILGAHLQSNLARHGIFVKNNSDGTIRWERMKS